MERRVGAMGAETAARLEVRTVGMKMEGEALVVGMVAACKVA